MAEISMVITTYPDQESAEKITRKLLDTHLAACVQLEEIRSFYRWDGEIQNDPEIRLVIKTQSTHYQKVEALICENHPYELPQIIQIPITDSLQEYKNWVISETNLGSSKLLNDKHQNCQ